MLAGGGDNKPEEGAPHGVGCYGSSVHILVSSLISMHEQLKRTESQAPLLSETRSPSDPRACSDALFLGLRVVLVNIKWKGKHKHKISMCHLASKCNLSNTLHQMFENQ
jgi:hypothetical protein